MAWVSFQQSAKSQPFIKNAASVRLVSQLTKKYWNFAKENKAGDADTCGHF